ncbi:unnamed protein product [Victoria cruziana]
MMKYLVARIHISVKDAELFLCI